MVQKLTEVLSLRELEPGLRGALPALLLLLPFWSLSEGRAGDPKVGEGESVFLLPDVLSLGLAEAVVVLSALLEAVLAAVLAAWFADEPFEPESPHATNEPARMAAAATAPTAFAVPERVDRTDPL